MKIKTPASGPFALVVDVETTGLPDDLETPVWSYTEWPQIIEIAWQIIDPANDVLREHSFFVRPKNLNLDSQVPGENIHGIGLQTLLKEGVPAHLPLSLLDEDVQTFNPVIVAHNADFDIRVIRAAYSRESLNDVLRDSESICTMTIAADYIESYKDKWPTLTELTEYLFNETPDESHRALADVKATTRAFNALRQHGVIACPESEIKTEFTVDFEKDSALVKEATERYKEELDALPTYYDPSQSEEIGDDRFSRLVARRMSPYYQPELAGVYWTPYDAVSNRMALSLSAEDEVAKYILAITLEKATSILSSQVRYSAKALGRVIERRIENDKPVVTKVDIRQYYNSIDHSLLVRAVQDLTGLSADDPFVSAFRGSLAIPYCEDGTSKRTHGLSPGVMSEMYLAELFLERIAHDISKSEVDVVRLNDEFYICSESLSSARDDFSTVRSVLSEWNLTIAEYKTEVTNHRPAYQTPPKVVKINYRIETSTDQPIRWEGYSIESKDPSSTTADQISGEYEEKGVDIDNRKKAIKFVNHLHDSLMASRLEASVRASELKAKIEDWESKEGSIGVGSNKRRKKILSFDQLSHWLDYNTLTPDCLRKLVPLLHEYPRGEFHIYKAADVLVTAATECVHQTKLPGHAPKSHRTELQNSIFEEHETSTALCEAAHFSILAILESIEIHPHVVYIFVRRMYKEDDSLDFNLSEFKVKQVYARSLYGHVAQQYGRLQPKLPFQENTIAALESCYARTQHLPLKKALDVLLAKKDQS